MKMVFNLKPCWISRIQLTSELEESHPAKNASMFCSMLILPYSYEVLARTQRVWGGLCDFGPCCLLAYTGITTLLLWHFFQNVKLPPRTDVQQLGSGVWALATGVWYIFLWYYWLYHKYSIIWCYTVLFFISVLLYSFFVDIYITLFFFIFHYIMNHILLCHIRLCYILLCHILLHHIPMYHIVLDCIVFFCIVPFSISFCYIVLLLFFHIICYVTICVVQFISSKYYIELFCTLLNFCVIPSYRHLFPLEIIFVRWLQSSGEAMGLLAKTNQDFMKCPKRKGIWNTSRPFFFLLLMLGGKSQVDLTVMQHKYLGRAKVTDVWNFTGFDLWKGPEINEIFFLNEWSKERSFW